MFSGIVEEIGHVVDVNHSEDKSTLVIKADTCFQGVSVGDSISVNGVCLTMCKVYDTGFIFEVMPETLRLTSLGLLEIGGVVNLERSITPATRIGGHFVQGHIDGKVAITSIVPDGCALKIWFNKLDAYADCFIPKGYITIDGMSLTIVDVTRDRFSICFIPHTQDVTIVKHYRVGTQVNIEVDHIVKTIAMMLKQKESEYGKYF